MSLESEARLFFEQHYNCAQSVFGVYAERMGMNLETAFRVATPFGGGMGHNGQVCGAVSGGLMAIGLARGIAAYDEDKKYACYDLAVRFQDSFTELHGDLTCPGLLGLDIGIEEELAQVREEGLFQSLCPVFVGDAVRIVSEVLGMEG